MTPQESEDEKAYPNCCRKLFTNCDGVLSCIAPFGEDVTTEM
jgi:hypothetical protein